MQNVTKGLRSLFACLHASLLVRWFIFLVKQWPRTGLRRALLRRQKSHRTIGSLSKDYEDDDAETDAHGDQDGDDEVVVDDAHDHDAKGDDEVDDDADDDHDNDALTACSG